MTRDEIKSLLIDHLCDHPSGELLDRLASEQPRPSQDVVEALVRTFRALPLDGDAGCDKLTDDEWRTVALAALSEQPRTDVPVLTPEEEAELVERINSSANLQPRTGAADPRIPKFGSVQSSGEGTVFNSVSTDAAGMREQGQREGKAAVCNWLRSLGAQKLTPKNAEVAAQLADAFEQSEIPGLGEEQ